MKTKIRTILFGSILTVALLLPGGATAQGMPTYDNVNFISLIKTAARIWQADSANDKICKVLERCKRKH